MDDRDPEAFRALYGTVCRYLAARVHRSAVEDVARHPGLRAARRLRLRDRRAPQGVHRPAL